MLEHIHFLLTYTCNYECDHCFLYCGPNSEGTFTIEQIETVLKDALKIESVEWIYFEGGEPFLYYPLMLEGIKLAKQYGFKTGIVTNNYWATTVEDAKLWLKPIIVSGIDDLSISQDSFHQNDSEVSTAEVAIKAAKELGYNINTICIDKPTVQKPADNKGAPVISGGTLLKGRAVEKLAIGLTNKPIEYLNECKYEELVSPKRVHIDSYGNVQVCQGISIGNLWKTPISQIIKNYDYRRHPICSPLVKGGPYELGKQYGLNSNNKYATTCHYCYSLRLNLIDKFPEQLTPRQVYGI